jgi:hypothetical protein
MRAHQFGIFDAIANHPFRTRCSVSRAPETEGFLARDMITTVYPPHVQGNIFRFYKGFVDLSELLFQGF